DVLGYAESFLISPAIELSGGNVATLQFWHSYDFSGENFDGGELLLVTNNATATLASYGWLANSTDAATNWTKEEFDLTPYLGHARGVPGHLLVHRHEHQRHFGRLGATNLWQRLDGPNADNRLRSGRRDRLRRIRRRHRSEEHQFASGIAAAHDRGKRRPEVRLAIGSGPRLSVGWRHRSVELDAAVRLGRRDHHNFLRCPRSSHQQRALFLPPRSAALRRLELLRCQVSVEIVANRGDLRSAAVCGAPAAARRKRQRC